MEIKFSFISFLLLAFIVYGLIVSIILWRFADKINPNNRILSLAIVACTWTTFVLFTIESCAILSVPCVYRTGQLALLIFIPLMYLYIRAVVLNKKVDKWDILHFAPLAFYIIDYFPVLTMPDEAKLAMIMQDMKTSRDYYSMNDFDEGWISPAGFHYYFRHIVLAIYWVLQARIAFVVIRKVPRTSPIWSITNRTWIGLLLIVQLFIFFPFVFRPQDPETQWLFMSAVVGLPSFSTGLWLFFKPELLYSASYVRHQVRDIKQKTDHEQIRLGRDGADIGVILKEYMIKSKKFRMHRYSITDLSNDVNITPHHLSNYLNQHLQISYSDFLNKFRVEYAIEKIKNGEASRFTLEALSEDAGFSNRNSFTAAFKRLTGLTPSDFIRSQQNESNGK